MGRRRCCCKGAPCATSICLNGRAPSTIQLDVTGLAGNPNAALPDTDACCRSLDGTYLLTGTCAQWSYSSRDCFSNPSDTKDDLIISCHLGVQAGTLVFVVDIFRVFSAGGNNFSGAFDLGIPAPGDCFSIGGVLSPNDFNNDICTFGPGPTSNFGASIVVTLSVP